MRHFTPLRKSFTESDLLNPFAWLRGRDIDEKSISGTPQVLEALRARQFGGQYISLGSSPNARRDSRIDGLYVAVQNGSYGWIYRCQPAARRVIDYLAGNIAQLSCKLYERIDDDDREQRGDHPAAQTLRRPNQFTPGKSFLKGFVKDFLIYDNAYAVKLRAPGVPLTLVRVSPSMVGILGASHFQADGYRIWRANGEFFDVEVSDVLHWRGENPDDPRRGESKLETLREELALDAANRGAAAELARSGLALAGWIYRPGEAPEWSTEARKRFEEDWANRAKQGHRKTPVLEEGMEFKQGGVSPEDAELLAGRRFAQEYVASLYGLKNVPVETDEERRAFYTDILPDYTSQLVDFLNLQILEQEYSLKDYYYEFSIDDKLMGDERIKTLTSAAGAPILLRDEARSKLNLPALPDGEGQEVIVPMNVTEGGKPTPGTMPVQDPNKTPQDGSARTGDAEKPDEAGTRALEPERKRLLLPRRVAKLRRRDLAAQDTTDEIAGFLSHMERSLKSKQMDIKAVEDDRWIATLSKSLEEVNRRTVKHEGEATAKRLASSFNMGMVRNYVKKVSDAKAQEIVHAVQKALREGADASEVFKNGREVAAVNAGMTIATALSTFATQEAAFQDDPEGQFRTKTWIVTSSNSDHPEMDGESVPLGESFSNGTDGPPADHPGCQCLMEIDGGGHPKAIGQMPAMHFNIQIPEGAFKSEVNVQSPPAPNVSVEQPNISVTTPDVNVAPAQVTIEKGAVTAPNVTVEPADMTIEEGAIQVTTPDVHMESAPVNVDVKSTNGGRKPRRIITFSDGRTAEISAGDKKRIVKFSDGRTAEINEQEDDD